MKVWLFVLLQFSFCATVLAQPDPQLTPGVLCTAGDPYFSHYAYDEDVPICTRHVTIALKEQIAGEYGGIDREDWHFYEFDHLIPLCAGGSNDIGNLWPEPIAEAKQKDKLELEVCKGLRNGQITQSDAVEKVMEWVRAH